MTKKKYKIERREQSYIKPIIYLLLQVIALLEFFWILTGSANLKSWNYLELLFCTIVTIFFAIKTVKIIKRTQKNFLDTEIEKEKFLETTS